MENTTDGGRAPAAGGDALRAIFPGDGEMAQRCRSLDWAATPLGPVASWAASLRTAAAVVVAARQPMFLWWGPGLVQLYNDGCRSSLGAARHPAALGAPGPDFWADAWPVIGPDVESILAGAPAVWYEDHLVPIERDGRRDDVCWSYGCTPVPDDAGRVGGVLVTAVETTAHVQARAAEAERARLAQALAVERTGLLEDVFRKAPSFLHVLAGPEFVIELANPAYYQLVGHRDLIGRPAFEAMPEAAAGGFPERLAAVRATGEPFVGRDLPVTLARTPGAPPEERLIDLVYLPLPEPDGTCARVLGHGVDVTEHVLARRRAEADSARLLAEVAAERERLRRLILSVPAPLALHVGPAHRFDLINPAFRQISGGGRDDTGLDVRAAFPELIGQGIFEALDRVYATGEPWIGSEIPIRYDRDGTGPQDTWYNIRYEPVRGADGEVTGVLNFAVDVTDQVRARLESERLLAESEAANTQLQEQAIELELSTEQLQEQAVELESQAEELHATAAELEERTEAAEASLAALAETEARFRAVEDASPDAVLLLEPVVAGGEIVDFEFVYANPAAGRMLGGGRVDALVGSRMLALFPSTGPEGYVAAYARAFATGAPYAREDRYTQDRLDLGVRVTAVRAGGLLHVRVEDIGERLQAEAERGRLVAALELEASRLADVFRHAPAYLAVFRGPAHVIHLVNDAYYQLVGHRDMIGKPLLEAVPEIRDQGFVELLDGVLRTGAPFVGREMPVILARTPGAPPEQRFVDFTYLPLLEPDGTRAGVIAHGTDVTQQVHARREAERLLAEAEAARREATAANQAKSGFLATMSHELRTPINAVIGYAQLLDMGLAGPLTEQQRAYLERLTGSSRHLLGLVADVLDLSKIEAGETRVAHEDATTGPAVRDGLDVVAPAAAARGVRLVDARLDEAGVPFVGDEDRVRQVVLNLLSNAVKFTAPGGTITVTSETVAAAPAAAAHLRGAGPWALVRVADTGVGIAPEEQGRIFEPFHQVQDGKNAYTRTAGGTGLGLAISRRLARLMGGDLSVESAHGVGSAFTLWLPAARHDAGQPDETAGDRSARAERDFRRLETPGLGEVGGLLHEAVTEVVAAYTDRLRADPGVPRGATMTRVQLEDHAISFLADLAQSLVIVGDAGPEAVELLKDGSAIQRTIAEAHGARRHAQGWDEAALRRDQQVFREEVERAMRDRLKRRSDDVNEAVRVLLELIDRGQGIAQGAWRRAAADAVRTVR